ncbi:MAG: serine/threonine-protein kinase [Burkholderiales bacterium]
MPIPERLGKYAIQGILGKGAMGVVYKAHDPGIKRLVAIKTIRMDLMEDSTSAESISARFRNEAQAAGALAHPGIVAVYDYGEDAELAYIAMEYVEGNSLREYFHQKRAFSIADVASLMTQLLDALEAAHQHAIWHRDIKPANLIITGKGRLKVADFGIARIEASELTRAGDIMGTPGYMASEMYRGEPIDHRVDIFAAGVVMYQLIAGKAPFQGTAEAITYKVIYENPTPPSRENSSDDWTPYDAIVATALAKEPEQRFATVAAFRKAVLAAYSKPPNAALSEDTIIPAAPPLQMATPRLDVSVSGQGATNKTTPPTGWDPALLGKVERELARVVGPLAKVITRRAAQVSPDLPALIDKIAEEIDDPNHRRAFRHAMHDTLPGTQSAGASVPSTARTPANQRTTFAPETLDRATDLLKSYIGPIARVVVARAAQRASSVVELHQLVAAEIPTERARTQYLQKLATKPA